jgi:hypothetical protein
LLKTVEDLGYKLIIPEHVCAHIAHELNHPQRIGALRLKYLKAAEMTSQEMKSISEHAEV